MLIWLGLNLCQWSLLLVGTSIACLQIAILIDLDSYINVERIGLVAL